MQVAVAVFQTADIKPGTMPTKSYHHTVTLNVDIAECKALETPNQKNNHNTYYSYTWGRSHLLPHMVLLLVHIQCLHPLIQPLYMTVFTAQYNKLSCF